MERQNQNPNWTKQFSDLPEGWDIDPATFERVIQERIFHCDGVNCSIKGKILTKGEGMLKFVKVTATKAVTKIDGITPERDPKSGDPLFERTDVKRAVFCDHHIYLEQIWVDEILKDLPADSRKRGDKLEMKVSTLFQNFSWVREMTQKAKRSERVAKFFLSLTEGADISVGVALECIAPFSSKDDKKTHNFLVRGGEVVGLVYFDDVAIYHGVRHQHKAEFVSANIYLYSDSTWGWVKERLVEWRKGEGDAAAKKAAREAEAAERLATAKALNDEEVARAKSSAAELLAFFVGTATPATESSADGDGRKGGSKKPKPRKSAPPPAAKQIDGQLAEGGRVAPLSEGAPDTRVDESAGSSKPTHAVALGDRPEVAKQLAAARAAIDPTE